MTEIIASKDELSGVIEKLNLSKNEILLLVGDLGSGKTSLISAIVRDSGLDYLVSSPTFSLLNQYDFIFHYDLYNREIEELLSLGILEILSQEGLHLLEWGDKLQSTLDNFGFKYKILTIEDFKNVRKYTISKN